MVWSRGARASKQAGAFAAAGLATMWLGRLAVGCAFDLSEPVRGAAEGGTGGVGPGSGGAAGVGPVTAGSSTASGSGGDGGMGGMPPMQTGCSDGYREAYGDDALFPNIAACAGGFAVAGVRTAAEPGCTQTGDDSGNPEGTGCSAANLCAVGWHVCMSSLDVDTDAGGTGCPDDMPAMTFWATGQTENTDGNLCVESSDNNVVGCGNEIGENIDNGCFPLDRRLRFDDCGNDPDDASPWLCPDGTAESAVVTKPGAALGGVLCCKD